jgi:hypothetical protein
MGWILPALLVAPFAKKISRGTTNAISTLVDATRNPTLAKGLLNGGLGKAFYTGVVAGGDGFLVPSQGEIGQAGGARKKWDRINGYQLPDTKGTSTRVSPIKYRDDGAPLDPNTGQARTGNIYVPPLEAEPPVLASVPPAKEEPVVLEDPEKARAAAAAAEKYKKEQAAILDAHKNYKTMREFGGEPVVTQDYMEQDAMKIWANANPELAKKLIEKHQLDAGDIFTKPGESNMPVPEETPFTGATTVAQLLSTNSNPITWTNPTAEPIGNLAGIFKNTGDKSRFLYDSNVQLAPMPMARAVASTVEFPKVALNNQGQFRYS